MLVLKQFFEVDLSLNPDDIVIERAHRLGRKKRNRFSKRPIIAAFNNYADTVKILNSARLLRGTQFSVDRDYPVEITNARKLLWPKYKALKQNKRENDTVQIQYPARLVKNNVVIDDAFPGWAEIMKGTRITTRVRNSNTSNAQASENLSSGHEPATDSSQGDRYNNPAGERFFRSRDQNIEELPWGKQPAYEMGAQRGGWGSGSPQLGDPASQMERTVRLKNLEHEVKMQRRALKELEELYESERQAEHENQGHTDRLIGTLSTDPQNIRPNQGQGHMVQQEQVEQGPSQVDDEQEASQSLLAGMSVKPPDQINVEQSVRNYEPVPEQTPMAHMENTRKVSPSILQRMRRFEKNDNDTHVSSEGSSEDSDNEFYSQYVQGTKPRNFGVINNGNDIEQMVIGDDETNTDLNGGARDKDTQKHDNDSA